jgi:hypothetical protein
LRARFCVAVLRAGMRIFQKGNNFFYVAAARQ